MSRHQRPGPAQVLRELEERRAAFGPGQGAGKLRLLRALAAAELGPAALLRLHEALLFLCAHPDDAAVLTQARAMLRAFADRPDLRAARGDPALAGEGVAGTAIRFRFFAATAQWLAARHPEHLWIDWPAFGRRARLEHLLHLLASYPETPALDEYALPVRDWLDRLRGPVPDGTFLVRRLAALGLDPFVHEALCDDLDVPFELRPGPGTPSRTVSMLEDQPPAFQRRPLRRERPDLLRELRRPPAAVRALSPREGRRYVDLAREAMVTRARDLDAFAYGDPGDVRLIDCGEGLQFAAIGVRPERRLLFEAVYGFLVLRNGVPLGYVLNSALYGSAEVAYNVFETFRGGEAGWIYGRFLAALHHLLGVDTFTIYPYQLGWDNEEGLRSGAFWFYGKLGFRPRDSDTAALMAQEEERMRRDPGHRSGMAVLRRLARENVYLHAGAARDDVIGLLPLAAVGARVMEHLAARFGADRERGLRECAAEAARRLGLRAPPARSAGERLAFLRWAPVVVLLPGLEQWSPAERRALAGVVLAKGGRRESAFVRRFDRHRRLRAALLELAQQGRSPD